MARFKEFVITDAGNKMMSAMYDSVASCDFTRVVLSSHIYEESELPLLSNLLDIKQAVDVLAVSRNSNTEMNILAIVDNKDLKEGYHINTLGLFAKDNSGTEILYAVVQAESAGDMPAYTDAAVSGLILDFAIAVSNAENVVVKVASGYELSEIGIAKKFRDEARLAQEAAEAARDKIINMSTSSEALPVGSEPAVEKNEENGVVNLHFKLPQGANGTSPHIGGNGNWWIGEVDTGVKAEGEGTPGASGLPDIVEWTPQEIYAEAALPLPAYSEVRISDEVDLTILIGYFLRNTKNPGNDMWTLTFTAGEGISVQEYFGTSKIEWAVAEPVFTPGYTYYLSFIPLVDKSAESDTVFKGTLLGVWVAKELTASE